MFCHPPQSERSHCNWPLITPQVQQADREDNEGAGNTETNCEKHTCWRGLIESLLQETLRIQLGRLSNQKRKKETAHENQRKRMWKNVRWEKRTVNVSASRLSSSTAYTVEQCVIAQWANQWPPTAHVVQYWDTKTWHARWTTENQR